MKRTVIEEFDSTGLLTKRTVTTEEDVPVNTRGIPSYPAGTTYTIPPNYCEPIIFCRQ